MQSAVSKVGTLNSKNSEEIAQFVLDDIWEELQEIQSNTFLQISKEDQKLLQSILNDEIVCILSS